MRTSDKLNAIQAHYAERNRRKVTQAVLAEIINVSQATISRWMNGVEAEGEHAQKLEAAYQAIQEGPPPTILPVMGYVGAGAEIEPDFEQVPEIGLKSVEVHLPLPPGLICFEVVGDSMHPQYEEGSILVVWKEARYPLEAYFGHQVVVRLRDGRRFVKTPLRSGSGVALHSWNARLIEDVEIEWIGEIEVVIPPRINGTFKRR